nr:immunoglobulin light chain junction region [Macaca mulatta]MOW18470.1 immunoglobulin light chain junction region [Macaca mulatta]
DYFCCSYTSSSTYIF